MVKFEKRWSMFGITHYSFCCANLSLRNAQELMHFDNHFRLEDTY